MIIHHQSIGYLIDLNAIRAAIAALKPFSHKILTIPEKEALNWEDFDKL
ncbi:hypothetical protein [Scytonema hofmannii]|nr:hypothetical protein [Scytonema hofmannii]